MGSWWTQSMAMRRSNGAHTKKSEAGASIRKERRGAAVGEVIERVLLH